MKRDKTACPACRGYQDTKVLRERRAYQLLGRLDLQATQDSRARRDCLVSLAGLERMELQVCLASQARKETWECLALTGCPVPRDRREIQVHLDLMVHLAFQDDLGRMVLRVSLDRLACPAAQDRLASLALKESLDQLALMDLKDSQDKEEPLVRLVHLAWMDSLA